MPDDFSMSGVSAEFERRIRANRLLNLPVEWRDEIIFPYYYGLSILNVARNIAAMFGVAIDNTLDTAVWNGESPSGDIDRVVLVITDGLAYKYLKQLMVEDADLRADVGAITDGRGAIPLTSVAPSTTLVALPTFWTAQPAMVHGMMGTFMYLREFSMLVNMLRNKPAGKHQATDSLATWGFDPNTFVPTPSIANLLAGVGVPTHVLLDSELAGTGLSRILHRDVTQFYAHGGLNDSWIRLHELLTETAGKRCFVSAYWHNVDKLSHMYGAHNHYTVQEIKAQMKTLREILTSDGVQDGRTLALIVADHGHHNAMNFIDLTEGAATEPIRDALRGQIGGDTRFAYFMIQDGYKGQVIDAIERDFSDLLAWIDPHDAIEAGLFGPGMAHPEMRHRIGDLIVIPRLGSRVWDVGRAKQPISMHGGLSDWEMLVPLMYKRI
jgi:hypothetical protein